MDGNEKTKARLLGAAEKSDPAGESKTSEHANYEHGGSVSEHLEGTNLEKGSGP